MQCQLDLSTEHSKATLLERSIHEAGENGEVNEQARLEDHLYGAQKRIKQLE
jgi:hypothetical protein